MNPGFIQQTAFDYDMDPYDVERIYKNTDGEGSGIEFYKELENFIKNR